MPAVLIKPTETQVLASEEYKELSEKITIYEAALKERNGEITKLREEVEAVKAREAEKEPVDDIMYRLVSDPEVQRLLLKKMEDLRNKDCSSFVFSPLLLSFLYNLATLPLNALLFIILFV